MITSAERFDSLYESLFARERRDWSDRTTATEILGYLDELIKHAGTTGGELLELGCGTGTLSFPLAERGYRVTGLDISAKAIAVARDRADESGSEIVFGVHDIRKPLTALVGRFALVVDSLMLHYLTSPDDRIAGLRLAADALQPDGALLIVTMIGNPRYLPPGSWYDRSTGLLMTEGLAECHYGEVEALTELFADAGLQPSYSRLIQGSDLTRAQDMYLGVLRRLT